MLVLSRKETEQIMVAKNGSFEVEGITITIVRIDRGKIRIGISAPADYKIMRGELLSRDNQNPKGV